MGGEQGGPAGYKVDASRLDGVRRRCQGGGRGDLLGQTVLVTVARVLKRVWLMRCPKGRFGSQAGGEAGAVGWWDGEVELGLSLHLLGKSCLTPAGVNSQLPHAGSEGTPAPAPLG